MFFGVIFIALGLAILLNALGILNGTFWGFFWGLFFIVIGLRMMMKKEICSLCGWHGFKDKCCEEDHEHNQE